MNWTERSKRARALRERLFRLGKPFVRTFDMAKDAWVLWAAYDLKSFPALKEGMKPDEFFAVLRAFIAGKSSVLLIEDDHKYFRERRGPTAMVSIDNYGWRIEPQVDFFFWATKRHRLRAAVSFLHMTRHSKQVGVCVVRVGGKDVPFAEHLGKYDLLSPCGRIPQGRPDGDEQLFYLECARAKKLRVVEKRAA